MTETHALMGEADQLLRALRAAAVDRWPDGWVNADDVRQQLHRRGELAPMCGPRRVGERIEALLCPALAERHENESGAVFYRVRREA